MYNVDVQLRQRNNTIKLLSLVHNQFCSVRLRGMICYSWHACGCCDEKPATFQTPVEFCFDQVRHPAVTFALPPAVTFALPDNSLHVAGARQNCAIIFFSSITSATIMLSS